MKRRHIFALISLAYIVCWFVMFGMWLFPLANASMFGIMDGGVWFSNELSQFEISAIVSFLTVGTLALFGASAFVLSESIDILARGALFIARKLKNKLWK